MSTHFLVYLLQYSYKQKRISRQFVRVGLQPLTRVSFCPCMLTCTRISHARTMLVDCNQIASVTLSLSKTAPPGLHYLCFTHSLSRTLLYWLLLPNQFLPDIWQQVIIRKKKQKKNWNILFQLKKNWQRNDEKRKSMFCVAFLGSLHFFCWLLTLLLLLKESKKKICNYNLIAISSYCVARQVEKT